MDKNCSHEERNDMSIPQKKDEQTFKDFVEKHKKLLYDFAKSNTVKDESGLTVIPKDDPWRDEEEWDAMYKDLKNE